MAFISLSNVFFGYDADRDLLAGVSVVFNDTDKVAIVGDNGSGKTTMLRMLNGDVVPDTGQITQNASVFMLKQINAQEGKSGGEAQSDALAHAFNSRAEILLLDEPTNNLDAFAKQCFFDRLMSYPFGAVIVSHDRELLQRVDKIIELANGVLTVWGGNYDFWVAQKRILRDSMQAKYTDANKEIARLTGTLNIAQNMCQHHSAKQKKDKANRAAGSRIEVNALKGKSQETEAKRRAQIQKKLNAQIAIQQDLSTQMRDDKIKIPVPNKAFYSKELVRISDMCFSYNDKQVFNNFDFSLMGCTRVRLCGRNGAGKSTLLKLICGDLSPDYGTINVSGRVAYLNQNLSILDANKSVVENIMNVTGCLKHDAHAIAANFGFRGDASQKQVGMLSGGELLKATLAAVLGGAEQPDLLILDEPTNNLELKSIEILEDALNQYRGAILLVSHDETFAKNINIDTVVNL
ncbi:MAG: ATP-binding cassette domain-containing protein [Alphaproteobacteria bacterium]|nr:ATP-binding cassette domain-containing protein [Alphaproteobacteria bacterium]